MTTDFISLAIGGASNTPIHFFYFFFVFRLRRMNFKTVLKNLYLFWANIFFRDHFVDIRYLTYYQHLQDVWSLEATTSLLPNPRCKIYKTCLNL